MGASGAMQTSASPLTRAQRTASGTARPPVSISVNWRRPSQSAPVSHGHDFSRLPLRGRGQTPTDTGPTPTPTPTPAPVGGGGGPTINPSLSLSNDRYNDSGNTSHKN